MSATRILVVFMCSCCVPLQQNTAPHINSPFYALFDKHPLLEDLKIFGSTIYLYLKHYNDNKFQSRTFVCIFFGYGFGYNGAICYNLQSKKLILPRHVFQDESLFPAKFISPIAYDIT